MPTCLFLLCSACGYGTALGLYTANLPCWRMHSAMCCAAHCTMYMHAAQSQQDSSACASIYTCSSIDTGHSRACCLASQSQPIPAVLAIAGQAAERGIRLAVASGGQGDVVRKVCVCLHVHMHLYSTVCILYLRRRLQLGIHVHDQIT